mgnify:CR=1 FL=1
MGLSALSLIVASCSSEDLWTESDEDVEYLKEFSDDGCTALSIKLSKDEASYLSFLNKLGKDITKDPVVARQFAKNPTAFVKQYGYKGEINLDEGMLKLVLALGDEEINTAINQNDITTAVALMESKGILDDAGKSDIKLQFSDEEVKKIYESMGIEVDDEFISQKKYCSVAAVWLAYVVAAVYSQAGVVYNAAAAINAAVWFTVYAWTEAWGQAKDLNNVCNANLPLKIWSLKGQYENSYVAADAYVTDQSKKVVDYVKSNNPDMLQYVSESQLEQIIKINLINSSFKKK